LDRRVTNVKRRVLMGAFGTRPGMIASASGTTGMLRICNFGKIRNPNRFYS
jgi:hypothetical protein